MAASAASSARTTLPAMPPSPTASYTSTAVPASTLNLPFPPAPSFFEDMLSRADIAHSITTYENLLSSAKAYRKALSSLSTAASSFGAALEASARCKGSDDHGHEILSAAGMQYLIAGNTHILGETVYRGFEVPLLHELDSYKEKTVENEERYKAEEARRGKELRCREGEYLKLARQKRRNFNAYRTALSDLTRQIDELDELKYEHYRLAHSNSSDFASRILDSAAFLVRAEVELFEKVAQKGWDGAGGGLDDLIARAPDPFAPDIGSGADAGEGTIFGILPSQSILPSPHSPVMTGVTHPTGTGATTLSSHGLSSSTTVTTAGGKYRSSTTEAASPVQNPHQQHARHLHHSLRSLSTSIIYDDDMASMTTDGRSIFSNTTGNGYQQDYDDEQDHADDEDEGPGTTGLDTGDATGLLSPSMSSAGWGGGASEFGGNDADTDTDGGSRETVIRDGDIAPLSLDRDGGIVKEMGGRADRALTEQRVAVEVS